MRIVVVAVGRLRPPFADDVQHYQKLLAGHTRLELVEVREDEQVQRRLPDRAFVSLLHREGEQPDSVALSRWLEERRRSGRDLCFVIGGPFGLSSIRSITGCRWARSPCRTSSRGSCCSSSSTAAHKILAREPYHY